MVEALIHHKKSQEKDNGAAPGCAKDSAIKNTVPAATEPSKGKTPTNSASAGKAKTSVAARSSALPLPLQTLFLIKSVYLLCGKWTLI